MSEIILQPDTNFWKIVNGKLEEIELRTKTIADTSKYTPIGAYTSFRTYDRFDVLRLTKHLDRLEETASLAGHNIKLDRDALKKTLADLVAVSPSGEKRIRVGNMLPAIFLPILIVPLLEWLGKIF